MMPTEKHLRLKLQKALEKNKTLAEELRHQRALNRRARNRISSLESRCQRWKAKCKEARKGNASSSGSSMLPSEARIGRHSYSRYMVDLCLRLYLFCGCSLRGVVTTLELFYDYSKVPSKSSVSNWLRKSGYYLYLQGQKANYHSGYSLILDESMVIGQQRILLALIQSQAKEALRPLALTDVSVAMIQVKPSWKAVDVKGFLEQIERKQQAPPAYVVSDEGASLVKALKLLAWPRIADIGHQIALFLKRTYQTQTDFCDFSSAMNQVKFQAIMRPSAYLLPPKSRTDARFMNLSHQVKWAQKMHKAFPGLTQEEKTLFDFIPTYAPFIQELSRIFEMINPLLQIMKTEGLARDSVKKVYPLLRKAYHQANQPRPQKLITQIRAYLWQQLSHLPKPQSRRHISSDVIESAFGLFKQRKSPNPLFGVTPSVLLIPLRTKINTEKKTLSFSVKEALEQTTLKQIDTWAQANLIPNQVTRRRKTLKKVTPF